MTKLSAAERAILINQFRILAALADDEAAYDNTIEVLERGYEAEYKYFIEGLRDPLSEEDCKYVNDIMYIYYLMKLTKNKAALDDPGGDRDAQGGLRMEKLPPLFPGFDGNKDGHLLSYAKFLVEKRDAFIEHSHYLNSHGREPDYREMIEKWRGWGCPTQMTDAQVDELLAG